MEVIHVPIPPGTHTDPKRPGVLIRNGTEKGNTMDQLSFWEELGLSVVVGVLKKYAANPKALAPYKAVLQHIADDSAAILAGMGS